MLRAWIARDRATAPSSTMAQVCDVMGSPLAGRVPGARPAGPSDLAGDHHLLDLRDGLGRVQVLRAGVGAVHDRVAAIEPERIVQSVEALAGALVAAVDQPAIGLEQGSGAEEAVAVPPVARAGRGAAGAEDALVKAVEAGTVLRSLLPLGLGRGRLGLEPGLDRGVLGEEVRQVRH